MTHEEEIEWEETELALMIKAKETDNVTDCRYAHSCCGACNYCLMTNY